MVKFCPPVHDDEEMKHTFGPHLPDDSNDYWTAASSAPPAVGSPPLLPPTLIVRPHDITVRCVP
eukprot:1177267-Prorocentrum_minimum.AAC.3